MVLFHIEIKLKNYDLSSLSASLEPTAYPATPPITLPVNPPGDKTMPREVIDALSIALAGMGQGSTQINDEIILLRTLVIVTKFKLNIDNNCQ